MGWRPRVLIAATTVVKVFLRWCQAVNREFTFWCQAPNREFNFHCLTPNLSLGATSAESPTASGIMSATLLAAAEGRDEGTRFGGPRRNVVTGSGRELDTRGVRAVAGASG